ncbi:MAG: 2-phosphosulfolactate phosphatase [Gemmatimonadota bacterium]|nr:2-phosphosulfolactate phosphatase [Gemmatimonadota bacterium]
MSPGEIGASALAGRTVVVLDILRATTSIVEALGAGARSVFPVGSIEEAIHLANNFGRAEVLLAGERRCLPIEGFDLGNSPREFTPDRVGGKTIVITTTNGTAAMSLTVNAERVYIGALSNLSALVEQLVRTGAEPVFLCSGRERHFALEDVTVAGRFAQALMDARPGDWTLNDGARAAGVLAREFGVDVPMFQLAAGGQGIIEAGLAEDLAVCARVDTRDIIPVLHERSITILPSSVPATQ